MKRIEVAEAMLIVFVIVSAGPGAAGNWEYRGRMDMAGPIVEDISVRALTEVRSRNDLHTHNESHFDIGLEWEAHTWLAVGPYYRHVTEQKNNAWTVEHRLHLDVTFKWNFLGLSLSNRNRVEYRMMDGNETFRYRTRLMMKLGGRALPAIQPFISEEPYYDSAAGYVNKNRMTAGLDVKLLETISLGGYYVLDSVKSAGLWRNINALTIVVNYRARVK
jgi:hypothetical protein